jgi:hypothetical protein
MTGARRRDIPSALARLGPLVLAAILAAACATKPASPLSPNASPSTASREAAPASATPAATVQPAAAAAQSAAPEPAPLGPLPEFSFTHRSPFPITFIIASLHEPEIRLREAAKAPPLPEPVPAPATSQGPAVAAAAQGPSLPTAAQGPALPKAAAAALPGAAPKASSAAKPSTPAAKAAPAATAKSAAKAPEPKNAPSISASALVLDPSAEKKSDIARNFSAVEGTRFEVPFEGTGWTYLGEKTNREGIAYDSRRFTAASLVFVLNPVKAGDYILRFQRQDFLRGISYEELVGVTVAPKPASAASVVASAPSTGGLAPGYVLGSAASPGAAQSAQAAVTTPAPAGASATSAANAATAAAVAAALTAPSSAAPAASASSSPASAAATAASPAAASTAKAATPAAAPAAAAASNPAFLDLASLTTPEAALIAARAELAAGRVPNALGALDRLLALAPGGLSVPGAVAAGMDEAFILYAQAFEKAGPQKDIKKAYAYYKKIRDEYPESAFWDEAAARAAYIERHYFEIR